MSNNMNTPPTIRWQLLSTVSALSLLASACAAGAAGTDADRPLIWVELGGQMESMSGQGEVFAPAFLAANSSSPVFSSVTPLQAQRLPKFSFGEEGKISFQPEDSDWLFSAAIRYGRSGGFRHVDHQTNGTFSLSLFGQQVHHTQADFADTQARRRESHAIVDFTAGRDVGLGMFGRESSSTLNLGVRFAQFTSAAAVDIRARPDLAVTYKYGSFAGSPLKFPKYQFHSYHATGHASRSFNGVGPSLSWTGSAPFAGNQQDGELTFDWGANAALLFGKQKARVQHQETAQFKSRYTSHFSTFYKNPPTGHNTDRSVTVPNVGGSVGLSWRVQDFKVSMGYRADFFFGAVDGGIDARKSETLGFKGPYASISVGLGD